MLSVSAIKFEEGQALHCEAQQSQRIQTVHNVRALGLERYVTVTLGVLVLAMAIIGRARWPLRPSREPCRCPSKRPRGAWNWPLRPTREPGRLPRSALAEHGMLCNFGASGA